jgi:hypothetical protein
MVGTMDSMSCLIRALTPDAPASAGLQLEDAGARGVQINGTVLVLSINSPCPSGIPNGLPAQFLW